jgi:3-phosphoshikimate 1-carboxyvinyltransferase
MKYATVSKTESFSLELKDIAPDKSISHRSAMFALLASGKTKIENFLRAEDTISTLKIVEQLGAVVEDDGHIITIEADGVKEPEDILDCGNSGTGMRLFCGLLSSFEGHFILTGDKYLCKRPMKRVALPLRSVGAKIDGRNDGDLAPLAIRGTSLKPFRYESPIASAQVKSAMILSALRASDVCYYKEEELTRDHTERMLKGMGANLTKDEDGFIVIEPLTKPLEPLTIRVPADPSSAFFFAVAAAITPNASVILKGVTLNPTRIGAYKVLEQMGANIEFIESENRYEPIGDIKVSYSQLSAVEVSENISWLIDELPALSIAFACAKGTSVVKNAKELRVKESDRISTVVTNLKKCGITTEEFEDGYTVTGGELQEAMVDSFGDHRIAMSFAVAGLKCGMKISDTACIDTSFPNFFSILSNITEIKIED